MLASSSMATSAGLKEQTTGRMDFDCTVAKPFLLFLLFLKKQERLYFFLIISSVFLQGIQKNIVTDGDKLGRVFVPFLHRYTCTWWFLQFRGTCEKFSNYFTILYNECIYLGTVQDHWHLTLLLLDFTREVISAFSSYDSCYAASVNGKCWYKPHVLPDTCLLVVLPQPLGEHEGKETFKCFLRPPSFRGSNCEVGLLS